MSGVSSAEFILLLVIGLVVLGPKRLPEIANKIGGWIGQARRMTRVMRRQLEDELRLEDPPSIKSPSRSPNKPPASTDSAAPDPADPAYDLDETEPQVPNDDDTYSALHDETSDELDDESGDEAEREQSA